ncbi:hypothetical protein M407DRAFT_35172 [Tulasnella calospora MUT 4182]|uniref:Uncharacterized protein n=1 Tax=Tulasnella calospora MUT 4182 TaxID=1051891 RepID=A0A0C3L0J8_9AGAM|nr:hypothetical protein M407DRAFT_35172 [Tulasnella calospora MUT 4182]
MQTSPTAKARFSELADKLMLLRKLDLFSIRLNYHLNGHPELCDALTHDSDVICDGPFDTIVDPANQLCLRVFYAPTNKIMTVTHPSITYPLCSLPELAQAIMGGFGMRVNATPDKDILSPLSSSIQSFTPEDFSDQLGSWTDKFNEALELAELQADLKNDGTCPSVSKPA